jgi:LmbE family N-acetylglucosaminyl deacetylase
MFMWEMNLKHTPRLMAVLAHPDDESLGVGGALAKYAAEGVDVFLLTATRGDIGRYRGHRSGDHQHPGPGAATFRALGHGLVDQVADFLESLPRGDP